MGWLKNVFDTRQKVTPLSINDGNFQTEVKRFSGAVLLDIWGPACQPCAKLAPIMTELATQFKGKVKVCEMNAADAVKTAARLSVRGTPTTIAFKNGAEIGRIVGWKPESFWVQMIQTEFADILASDQTFDASPSPAADDNKESPKLTGKAARKAAKRARMRELRSDS